MDDFDFWDTNISFRRGDDLGRTLDGTNEGIGEVGGKGGKSGWVSDETVKFWDRLLWETVRMALFGIDSGGVIFWVEEASSGTDSYGVIMEGKFSGSCIRLGGSEKNCGLLIDTGSTLCKQWSFGTAWAVKLGFEGEMGFDDGIDTLTDGYCGLSEVLVKNDTE